MKHIITLLIISTVCVVNAQYSFEEIDIWTNGQADSNPKYLIEYNGELYFSARKNFETELWKSDGTYAGTQQVVNLNGTGSSAPDSFIVFNGELYFTATESDTGLELYKTDGTAQGTQIVKDIREGSSGSFYINTQNERQLFTVFNNELYFIVLNTNQPELWKTNGTEAGTVKVFNFNSGTFPVYSVKRETAILGVELNGFLYFVVETNNDTQLWRTDGTTTGTSFVTIGFNDIDELTIYNGLLYFAGENTNNGKELWRSDGTNTGTFLLHNIFPDNLNFVAKNSNPSYLTVYNNELYFKARGYNEVTNSIIGSELYKTNGSSLSLVKNINTTTNNADVEGSGLNLPKFIVYQNQLYFIASDNQNDEYDIWKTDGTEQGTVKTVDNLDVSISSFQLQSAKVYDNKLFFHNFQQLWISDGTTQGTMQLTDNGDTTIPILTFSEPMTTYNQKLWFKAFTDANKTELWSVFPSTLGLNDETHAEIIISVFPNPTASTINICSTQPVEKIELLSINGQLIHSPQPKPTLDISHLPSGIYLVRIKTQTNTITKKVIKE